VTHDPRTHDVVLTRTDGSVRKFRIYGRPMPDKGDVITLPVDGQLITARVSVPSENPSGVPDISDSGDQQSKHCPSGSTAQARLNMTRFRALHDPAITGKAQWPAAMPATTSVINPTLRLMNPTPYRASHRKSVAGLTPITAICTELLEPLALTGAV
jgi:hypothetical protein